MKDSAKYVKIVEWSEEDQCYVGSVPGLVFGGCHGSDEKDVFGELCQAVDAAIDLIEQNASHCHRRLLGVTWPPRCKVSLDPSMPPTRA